MDCQSTTTSAARSAKRQHALFAESDTQQSQQHQTDDASPRAQKRDRRTEVIKQQSGMLYEYDGASGAYEERPLDYDGVCAIHQSDARSMYSASDDTPIDPRADWPSLPMVIKAVIIGSVEFS